MLDLDPRFGENAESDIAAWVEERLAARAAARARRDFAAADAIRSELDGRGVVIEDTSSGTRWKRIRGGTPTPGASTA